MYKVFESLSTRVFEYIWNNEQKIKHNCMRKSRFFNLFLYYSSGFDVVRRHWSLWLQSRWKLERSVNNSRPTDRTFTFPFIKYRTDGRFAYKVIWLQNTCNVEMFVGFVWRLRSQRAGSLMSELQFQEEKNDVIKCSTTLWLKDSFSPLKSVPLPNSLLSAGNSWVYIGCCHRRQRINTR